MPSVLFIGNSRTFITLFSSLLRQRLFFVVTPAIVNNTRLDVDPDYLPRRKVRAFIYIHYTTLHYRILYSLFKKQDKLF